VRRIVLSVPVDLWHRLDPLVLELLRGRWLVLRDVQIILLVEELIILVQHGPQNAPLRAELRSFAISAQQLSSDKTYKKIILLNPRFSDAEIELIHRDFLLGHPAERHLLLQPELGQHEMLRLLLLYGL
jgi:hypothetical protein